MSTNWKHTLKKISMGLLLAGVLTGAFLLGANKRSKVRCTEIKVTIEDSTNTRFVTAEAVREYLNAEYKGLLGMPTDSIDLYKIESILNCKSPIRKSDAYITSKGVLNISVIQRMPAIRLQSKDYGLYSTADGYLLPLQQKFSADVLTIEGHIPVDTTDCRIGKPEDPQDAQWLRDILKMADYINSDKVWREKIGTITSQPSGELILKPKEGRETFLFGHPKDIEKKFEKIQIYYQRITADKGDNKYDVVDLRFKDQIVCKDTETGKKEK